MSALEAWEKASPELEKLSAALNAGTVAGAFDLDVRKLAAPLPRAFWRNSSERYFAGSTVAAISLRVTCMM